MLLQQLLEAQETGPFLLPKLPYGYGALAPAISAKTLRYHHGKHHAGYVKKLNELVKGTAYENMSLKDVVTAAKNSKDVDVYHNAAQAWNHTFYWGCLTPNKLKPSGKLEVALRTAFGDDLGRSALLDCALNQFGSGWAWLVRDDKGGVTVQSTSNADQPSLKPLLVVDVWEHAYYLDYENDRAAHLKRVIDKHLSWNFAGLNFSDVPVGEYSPTRINRQDPKGALS